MTIHAIRQLAYFDVAIMTTGRVTRKEHHASTARIPVGLVEEDRPIPRRVEPGDPRLE